jgi:hypothetical protein
MESLQFCISCQLFYFHTYHKYLKCHVTFPTAKSRVYSSEGIVNTLVSISDVLAKFMK